MKKIILIIITLIFCNLSFAEKIPIPELKSPVTDLTNTLYDYQIENIKSKLIVFEKSQSGQIAVLMIETTGEESIEEYSIRLAEQWKIGSAENDDGVILLIAKSDRKLRIEVGYGLEATITDAEAQYIIDELITPLFKQGDFNAGINNGIDRIIGLISGISPTLDEIAESYASTESTSDEDIFMNPWMIALFSIISLAIFVPFFLLKSKFYIMVLFFIALGGLELLMGAIAKDLTITWVFMIVTGASGFIPFLINLIGTLTGKKKYWNFSSGGSYGGSSSSYSSSSWSSSSSSSSYSGGGGSFGGGGASGSW